MATQAVEGSIAPTGDVVDFVIEIDNPTGFITPFGGVTTIVDAISGLELGGTITPTGTLVVLSPTACFPTSYTCVESNAVDYECVGSCETDTPINPEELLLGGIIIPVGQLVGNLCAPPVECPPVIVSNCNDVLRILPNKVIAWHLVNCGVLTTGHDEIGIAFHEGFEYEDIDEMEANGWIKETTYHDPTRAGWGLSTSNPQEELKSMLVNINGDTGPGITRYYKDVTLAPSTTYQWFAWVYQNIKHWYENTSGFDISGRTSATESARYRSPAGTYKELFAQGPTDGSGVVQLSIRVGAVGGDFIVHYDNIRAIGIIPNAIAVWEDQSGNGNDLTWVAGDKPTQTGTLLEGHNTMVFDNAYMVWPVSMLGGIEEIESFLIIKMTSGSGLWRLSSDTSSPALVPDSVTGKILENFSSLNRQDFGTPIQDLTTDFRLYSVHGAPTEVLGFINGALQAQITRTFDVSTAAPEFGRSNTSTPGDFEVAEILITKGLTDEERQSTVDILNTRWGLA